MQRALRLSSVSKNGFGIVAGQITRTNTFNQLNTGIFRGFSAGSSSSPPSSKPPSPPSSQSSPQQSSQSKPPSPPSSQSQSSPQPSPPKTLSTEKQGKVPENLSKHTDPQPKTPENQPKTPENSKPPPAPNPPPKAPPKFYEVEVDGVKVEVTPGSMLITACESAGIEIPRFCYHERLAVAGNCRMCLVEIEGPVKSPKPIASCAFPAMHGHKVRTNSAMVKKAREGVMEFLLANHPLDCPICDQGGECDLQDQAMVYGSDRSRYGQDPLTEIPTAKRSVADKDLGPLVKTVMTRCIHCTRCVRFANEIAGATELGTSGRGNAMEIGTYVEKTLIGSELSGNLTDVCPVGALTSKPTAFVARSWELRRIESIDVFDAVGSNIRVDSRGQEVIRILPRVNEQVNEEWLADKSRYACDGLKRQRLITPMILQNKNLTSVSWETALSKVREVLSKTPGNLIRGIVGQMADAESIMALKDVLNMLGSSNLYFEGELPSSDNSGHLSTFLSTFRSNYLLNNGLAGIENADALLLIGTNPRHEAPIYNARIRKSFLNFGLNVGLIGAPVQLTCEYEHLGDSGKSLESFIKGNKNSAFAEHWKKAKRPMAVIGSDVLRRKDAAQIFAVLSELPKTNPNVLTPEWNGISMLQRAASRGASFDLGFVPGVNASNSPPSVVYLLGADDISGKDIPKDAFVIYQGHHGDVGASYADIILPGAAYTEKSGTYVSTEGRVQQTRASVSPPGNSRTDWSIIRAIADTLGFPLSYNTLSQLRARMALVAPHFENVANTIENDHLPTPPSHQSQTIAVSLLKNTSPSSSSSPSNEPFTPIIKDYYLTDPISRASPTMAKCSTSFSKSKIQSPEPQSSHA